MRVFGVFALILALVLLCSGSVEADSRRGGDGGKGRGPGNGNGRPQSRSITRDVCVIGGGAAGTYAAVRLSQQGQTVAVVEAAAELGGHTNTYEDPATGTTYDYGVQVYVDRPIVRDFFATVNVPLQDVSFADLPPNQNIDFSTGEPVEFDDGDDEPDLATGLGRYAAELAKYPYLFPGYDLPEQVPADLLLPFGEFATKYKLGGATVRTIASYAQGVGEFLDTLTIYILKSFDFGVLEGATSGFIRSANNNNSAVYRNAEALFDFDVFLESQILVVRRPRSPPSNAAQNPDKNSNQYPNLVVIRNPSGTTVIRAAKLVVAFPQLDEKLIRFDLDSRERDIFSRFDSSGYYTTLLRNTGLPDGTAILAAGADTPFNVPVIPGPNSISPTGIAGLINLFYTTETSTVPAEQVKRAIVADILRLQNAGFDTTPPVFEVFESHNPFQLVVSAEEIAGGFYSRLNALQGYRGTYYIGAALSAHASSTVWEFTEGLLPDIVG